MSDPILVPVEILRALRDCLREQKEIADRQWARPGNTFREFATPEDDVRFGELLEIQRKLLNTIRDWEPL